ncbi:MAG: hypothetical protein QG637_1023 [Chloroflexota bacterium]|nr:hypothetical protein [Chloroflexota bacterium]
MTPQIRALLAHIFDEEDSASQECRITQAVLSVLVEASLAGRAPASVDAAAWAHIQDCPACGPLYRDALALVQAERNAALETPPLTARFDFAYLGAGAEAPTPAAANPLWWLDELGRLVIRFTADLLASLQPPALQPAYLKGAGEAAGETIRVVADDLAAHIRAEAHAPGEERCVVEVAVEIPSRGGWPNLAGITVSLRQGAAELASQETDAFGHAVFDDVPTSNLAGLVCVIAPANEDFPPG